MDDRNHISWVAELVLAELHAAGARATAVNLAGRCFLPSPQVIDALVELERAGVVTRRGRAWEASERRRDPAGPFLRRAERRQRHRQAASRA